jgi:aminoglycoside N3'-acetyltransferase
MRWGFETAVELARALKFLREKFAENKANKQTFSWVDSCCAWGSRKERCTAARKMEGALQDRNKKERKKKWKRP